jgi:fucose permease
MQNSNAGSSDKPKKKTFSELFSHKELWHYGIAALVYISLGVLFQNWVLNFVVGPLFIVVWMWRVAPLIDKWRAHRS